MAFIFAPPIKQRSNGSATYYPNQYYEQYGGTNIDKYYYFNGQPIAIRRNGTLYYLHQDRIGNLALVTSGGNRVDDQGFYAYGKLRRGIIGVERSFTGQQKDSGTGLIYFNARYYDPELGTFISPDTLVPDPTNLFAYNRYMYVIGNPLRYNDPTGHDFWDVVDTAVDFAQGVGAQVGYNNTVVALPSEINAYAPQDGESTSMQVGRFVGNVVTAVQGGAEMIGGATLGSGGAAACVTGVGCLAGAPALVGSVTLVAHGGTVATIGAANAGAQLGNVVMAVTGQGTGRAKNKLQPDLEATGEHTVIKRDPQTGDITGYETYQRSDLRNPNLWESQKRVDLQGAPHYDKATGQDILTPHVHEPNGHVRPANPDEIP